MIVVIARRDGSKQWCLASVERIEQNDNLDIVLITEDCEPIVVDRDRERIDIVGVD